MYNQSSFLRLLVPRMFPKLNMCGNNGEIGLGKKETFNPLSASVDTKV